MESASFTTQLGIDWKLLLSQVVNFALLLIILRFFVYKPILNMLKKRQEKIEEGLAKSEEADVRLKEVDNISKKRIKEVEKEAIGIIKNTEEKAKELENELLEKAKNKEIALFEKTANEVLSQKEQAQREIKKEAVELIKKALVKTVELSPEKIDEELIKKAVEQIG